MTYATDEHREAAKRASKKAEYAKRRIARAATRAQDNRPPYVQGRDRETREHRRRAALEREAQARLIQRVRPATLTGQLMGDPLPGRSALDKHGRH